MENYTLNESGKGQLTIKKYVMEHLGEFVLYTVLRVAAASFLVWLCGGRRYLLLCLIALIWSGYKIWRQIHDYKKNYLKG